MTEQIANAEVVAVYPNKVRVDLPLRISSRMD